MKNNALLKEAMRELMQIQVKRGSRWGQSPFMLRGSYKADVVPDCQQKMSVSKSRVSRKAMGARAGEKEAFPE
ncbi:hypothetical protein [Brevibacillus dissolubilis]|uniref:hypothetical protein n=1 Tax=Brevibacillus dissolubilis TaxID=1844116 RepID=UPI001115B3A2|nr:hypothetical protein [Brevibacillus dissolubilis]